MSDDKKNSNLSWLLNFRICIIYEKIISRVSKDNATSNKNEKGHDFQCSITYFVLVPLVKISVCHCHCHHVDFAKLAYYNTPSAMSLLGYTQL